MRGRHFQLEHRVDLDLLAEGRAQQFGDVEHGAVDVDIARLQRLPAGKSQEMLDQFTAAFRGLVDQLGGFLQRRLVRERGHQGFGGAGDDGQHVVEIVRDAAGEFTDGFELLRLLQLALGFAGCGDVVIDQRRAVDGARCVAQRPAGDHEVQRRAAVSRTDHYFLFVEGFAAQHLLGWHFLRRELRDAVSVVGGAHIPDLTDRHPVFVAQHVPRSRIRQQHAALGVDHEHSFRHGVEGVLQYRGRVPKFFMGCDQMLGPLGNRRLQHLVGGPGGAQRVLQFAARASGRQRQHSRENQDQRDAGQIDRQQDAAVGFRHRVSCRKQPSLFGYGLFEVGADRLRRVANFGPGHQGCCRRAVACGPEPDQFTARCNLSGDQRLGLLDKPCFARIILDGLDQSIECGQDCRAGFCDIP